jgi:hypothetical protein
VTRAAAALQSAARRIGVHSFYGSPVGWLDKQPHDERDDRVDRGDEHSYCVLVERHEIEHDQRRSRDATTEPKAAGSAPDVR